MEQEKDLIYVVAHGIAFIALGFIIAFMLFVYELIEQIAPLA